MEKLVTSDLKLGIIAGGQLGKMVIQDASKWNITTYVLDADEHCPAGGIASHYVQGDPREFDAVYAFGKRVDVLTFEIEHVNVEALHRLKAEGVTVVPDPAILELIQDKGQQKRFYQEHAIPTAPFGLYAGRQEITAALAAGSLHYPFVQKLRVGGYDGRGVAVVESAADHQRLLDGASVVEERVEIDREIAVIAARNARGQVRCFPTVEMVFDREANLVEKLICPSTVGAALAAEAERLAARLIEALGMAGLLAVEFFVDRQGRILVNEVAPRPHNSGHHTIESVITSQFEQHLRAILGLPLGSTHLKMPAVMLNLLGERGHHGPVHYEGLTESMALDGVKIHVYGKRITTPRRKMGHVTVLAQSLGEALERAEKVKTTIKVKAWDRHASAS